MGKTPLPPGLKILHGTRAGFDSGGRKIVPTPPFKRIPPNAPPWLSEEATAEWQRVAPGLTRLDLLKEEDRAALAAYCETWAQFVAATVELQAAGSLVSGIANRKMANPLVGIQRSAARELRSWAAQFGLTPAAENLLSAKGMTGDAEDSAFA